MTGDELARRLARARALREAAAIAAAPSPEPLVEPAPVVEAAPAPARRGLIGPGALRCRSCGTAIRWAVLPSGARVPCDHDPVTVIAFRDLIVAGELLAVSGRYPYEPVLYRREPVQRWRYGRLEDLTEVGVCGGYVVPPEQLPRLPRTRGARPHVRSCPDVDRWIPHRGHNGRVDPATGEPC